jgi:hypothetical protein
MVTQGRTGGFQEWNAILNRVIRKDLSDKVPCAQRP